MTKETTIIFLYDTELLEREEDDPNSAILYFYPTWVSDHQKTALCGQLIGTVLCLRGLMSMPKSVSLQTGKFYLIENGRYILVVGTDKNTPDWLLEHRGKLLYSLVKFFHKDFVALGLLYEDENLRAKLYHIFDTYLKLLYLGGSIFSNMPLWNIPKTDTTEIHKLANTFLGICQVVPHVLGGILLYHNKIINTQLSVETTKKITFSDPYRISNPAEISEQFPDLPLGVKLLQVFITSEEFQTLLTTSSSDIIDCQSSKTVKAIPETSPGPSFTSQSGSKDLNSPATKKNNTTKAHNKKSRPNSLILSSTNLNNGLTSTPTILQDSAVTTPMSEKKTFIDPPDVPNNKANITLSEGLEQTQKAPSLEILPQYLKPSIKLRRSNSVNDPLFPYTKANKTVLSQYFVNEVLGKEKARVAQRKKNLTLPIKPHNASEPQRSDSNKSLSGCLTPLMNKLSSANPFSLLQSSSNPLLNRNHKVAPEITRRGCELMQRCVLFLKAERDLVAAFLLTEPGSKTCLTKLNNLCEEHLPILEKQLEKHLGNTTPKTNNSPSEKNPYSFLNLDAKWDTVGQYGLWEGQDLCDLTHLHGNFMSHQDISDVYLRKRDSILFAHREGEKEIFYQEHAHLYKGVLLPNDALGTIRHTAKKKLEKSHNITIK